MSAVVDTLLAYPRFVADFFLLKAFPEFELRGTLSAALIAFFSVGFALALLIGFVSTPRADTTDDGDPPDKQPTSNPKRNFAEDIVRLTIVIVGGSLILHLLMAIYSDVVAPLTIGGALDTVNAAFGYGAVYLPIHAALTRIHRRIARIKRQRDTGRTKPVTVALGLFQLGFPVFFLVALGQVHGTAFGQIVRPALVSAVGTVVAMTGVVAIVLLLLRGNPPVRG